MTRNNRWYRVLFTDCVRLSHPRCLLHTTRARKQGFLFFKISIILFFDSGMEKKIISLVISQAHKNRSSLFTRT